MEGSCLFFLLLNLSFFIRAAGKSIIHVHLNSLLFWTVLTVTRANI